MQPWKQTELAFVLSNIPTHGSRTGYAILPSVHLDSISPPPAGSPWHRGDGDVTALDLVMLDRVANLFTDEQNGQ